MGDRGAGDEWRDKRGWRLGANRWLIISSVLSEPVHHTLLAAQTETLAEFLEGPLSAVNVS